MRTQYTPAVTRNKQHLSATGLVPWTDTIGGRLDRDFPGRLYVIASLRSGEYPVTAKLEELIGTYGQITQAGRQ
jgi:hypothetical protein